MHVHSMFTQRETHTYLWMYMSLYYELSETEDNVETPKWVLYFVIALHRKRSTIWIGQACNNLDNGCMIWPLCRYTAIAENEKKAISNNFIYFFIFFSK